MRGVLTIAGRELATAFSRPQAYVVLGAFVALLALLTLWLDDVLLRGVATMRGPFRWMSVCLLLLVPTITMGLLAEERSAGRLDWLTSFPWSSSTIVLGKWLSAVAFVALALVLTLPWPILVASYGELDPGPVLGGYFGLFLGACALSAVGTATSAWVEQPGSAFVLALELGLVPVIVGWGLPWVPADWVPFVETFTFDMHFSRLAQGVLDSRSVVVLGSVTALALRIATHLLERRRLA